MITVDKWQLWKIRHFRSDHDWNVIPYSIINMTASRHLDVVEVFMKHSDRKDQICQDS